MADEDLTLEDATGRGTAVLWPSAKQLAPALRGTLDLLVKVEPDRYKGIRLEVVDARGSKSQSGKVARFAPEVYSLSTSSTLCTTLSGGILLIES